MSKTTGYSLSLKQKSDPEIVYTGKSFFQKFTFIRGTGWDYYIRKCRANIFFREFHSGA